MSNNPFLEHAPDGPIGGTWVICCIVSAGTVFDGDYSWYGIIATIIAIGLPVVAVVALIYAIVQACRGKLPEPVPEWTRSPYSGIYRRSGPNL